MMNWCEKIKVYYNSGLWDITRVKNAVALGKITEAQFKEITGWEYTV